MPFIDLLSCCIAFLLITAVWTTIARVDVDHGGRWAGGEEEAPVDGAAGRSTSRATSGRCAHPTAAVHADRARDAGVAVAQHAPSKIRSSCAPPTTSTYATVVDALDRRARGGSRRSRSRQRLRRVRELRGRRAHVRRHAGRRRLRRRVTEGLLHGAGGERVAGDGATPTRACARARPPRRAAAMWCSAGPVRRRRRAQQALASDDWTNRSRQRVADRVRGSLRSDPALADATIDVKVRDENGGRRIVDLARTAGSTSIHSSTSWIDARRASRATSAVARSALQARTATAYRGEYLRAGTSCRAAPATWRSTAVRRCSPCRTLELAASRRASSAGDGEKRARVAERVLAASGERPPARATHVAGEPARVVRSDRGALRRAGARRDHRRALSGYPRARQMRASSRSAASRASRRVASRQRQPAHRVAVLRARSRRPAAGRFFDVSRSTQPIALRMKNSFSPSIGTASSREQLEVAAAGAQLVELRQQRRAPHPEVVVARPAAEQLARRLRQRVRHDLRRQPVDVRPAGRLAHQRRSATRASSRRRAACAGARACRRRRVQIEPVGGVERVDGGDDAVVIERLVRLHEVRARRRATRAASTPWKRSALFMYARSYVARSGLPTAAKRLRKKSTAAFTARMIAGDGGGEV